MSKFFAKKGEDYYPTGWITEEGEFIECESFDHDKVVYEKGLEVGDVEKKWIRIGLIFGRNHLQFEGKKLTKKQHAALEEWGLLKLAGKLSASDNFQKAYFIKGTP